MSEYRMNKKEIEKLVSDKTCDVAIESTLGYMDYHLQLLFEAMNTEDQEQVESQKEQLEKIREHLVALGHFIPTTLTQEA